ncbi:hypothetical protein, partial [Dialister succinatiphilus]|uniref:hypothetical protein n=1 Tax=Dialister succinatiphilus TaxID=487173 RepID=UPI00402A4D2E
MVSIMDLLFEIYYDSIFIFYYMYSEISIMALRTSPAGLRVLKFDGAIAPRVLKFDSGFAAEGCGGRLMYKPLWGLRVDGPLGRRFL